MRRREFISLVSGAAVAWPLSASAEQAALPVVGFLHTALAAPNAYAVAEFRHGLKEQGYIEGQNVLVEYRWAEGQYDRLPPLVAGLIDHQVAVIVAAGGNGPAVAAKAATQAIPIVFISGDDPVEAGLVASLSRPGGNVTGVSFFNSTLVGKRLELLHELLPAANVIAFLVNPGSLQAEQETKDALKAAHTLGLELHVLSTTSAHDIDSSFAKARELHAQGILMAADPFLGSRRDQVAALSDSYSIPVMGTTREYAASGCLISYATSIRDAYRQAGVYVGRILKGEKPAELPVIQPTRFELVINLKTAKALGITVAPTLLFRADEVIE